MNSNGYPFMTRRQILERIDAETAFAVECVAIIQGRHERRDAAGESSGWMASHAAKAIKIAAKLASGEASDTERAEAAQLVKSYSKQLARVFRNRELAARPELSVQAAVFGVGLAPSSQSSEAPKGPVTMMVDAPASTGMAAPHATPRKRGRPKGSKNKPKPEHSPRRRRS